MQNTGIIPGFAAEARRQQWQEQNQQVVIQNGDWVKASFPFENSAEHMWVKVTDVQGETIHGTLDSDPVFTTSIKLGDSITLNRSQVEQLLRL